MTTWDEQIPFRDHLDDPTDHIVETMAQLEDGVDLDPDQVRLLVSLARLAHRRCLSDWLRRNEPEFMAPPSTGPYAKWENRGRGNTGRFRDGSDIPKMPLVSTYFLCNRFYRRELGLKFNPNFEPLSWDEDFTYNERLAMLKGPAMFFVLVAQSVDFYNYTPELCKKVHGQYYRLLNRRLP